MHIYMRGRGAFCKSVKVYREICWDIRSENADMSNDNAGEKPARRKPKGSCAMLISAGLVGS